MNTYTISQIAKKIISLTVANTVECDSFDVIDAWQFRMIIKDGTKVQISLQHEEPKPPSMQVWINRWHIGREDVETEEFEDVLKTLKTLYEDRDTNPVGLMPQEKMVEALMAKE